MFIIAFVLNDIQYHIDSYSSRDNREDVADCCRDEPYYKGEDPWHNPEYQVDSYQNYDDDCCDSYEFHFFKNFLLLFGNR